MLSEQLSGNFSQQDISESETNARSANPNTSTRSLRFVGVGYSFDLSAVFVAKVFVECLEIVKLLTRLLKGGRNGLFCKESCPYKTNEMLEHTKTCWSPCCISEQIRMLFWAAVVWSCEFWGCKRICAQTDGAEHNFETVVRFDGVEIAQYRLICGAREGRCVLIRCGALHVMLFEFRVSKLKSKEQTQTKNNWPIQQSARWTFGSDSKTTNQQRVNLYATSWRRQIFRTFTPVFGVEWRETFRLEACWSKTLWFRDTLPRSSSIWSFSSSFTSLWKVHKFVDRL